MNVLCIQPQTRKENFDVDLLLITAVFCSFVCIKYSINMYVELACKLNLDIVLNKWAVYIIMKRLLNSCTTTTLSNQTDKMPAILLLSLEF